MARTRTALIVAAAVAAAATVLTASAARPPAAAPANPDPALFKHPQQNPFYPLTPGLVTRLRGTDGDEHFRQVVRITGRTRTVAGVETVVVRDVVRRADGSLAEATDDWYAADSDGNVWYFGEDTATYDEAGPPRVPRRVVGGRRRRRRGRDHHAGAPAPVGRRADGVRQGGGRGPGVGTSSGCPPCGRPAAGASTSSAPSSGAAWSPTSSP